MGNIDNYDIEQINNNGCLTICYSVEVIKEDGAATWESIAATKQRRVHPDFAEAFKPIVEIIARMLEFPLINSYSEKLEVYPLKIRFVDSSKYGKGVRFTVRLSNFAESDEKITITTPTYYKLAKYTKEDSEGITPINELTAQEWLQLERLKKEAYLYAHKNKCLQPTLEEAAGAAEKGFADEQ